MNYKYARGREKEWAIQHLFERLGYSTERTAGSHGAWDVHVTCKKEERFIQCKRQKKGSISLSDYEDALQKLTSYDLPDPQHPHIHKELWVWLDHKGWFCYRLTINNQGTVEFTKVEPPKPTQHKAVLESAPCLPSTLARHNVDPLPRAQHPPRPRGPHHSSRPPRQP